MTYYLDPEYNRQPVRHTYRVGLPFLFGLHLAGQGAH